MIKIVALASWIIQKFQVRIKWLYSKIKKAPFLELFLLPWNAVDAAFRFGITYIIAHFVKLFAIRLQLPDCTCTYYQYQ